MQAHSVQAERNSFEAVLNAWSAAKSEGNMNRLLGFYAPDFQSYKKKPLSEWATVLQAESQALMAALSTSRTRLTCAGRTRPTPWW